MSANPSITASATINRPVRGGSERRAYAALPRFDLDTSKKLTSLMTYVTSLTTPEASTEEDKKQVKDKQENAKQTCVCVSKYLRFAAPSSVTNADDMDVFAALRDIPSVKEFLQHLSDNGFTHSTILKYIHANAIALKWLAQEQLTTAEREALNQTRE